MFDTNTPGTGPVDHYAGAPRRPEHDEIQRSVYNGWKHIHGMKLLSIVMANGLSVMHGPHSARENDIGSVNISGLEDYLINMQAGQPTRYCAYGDGIFRLIARPHNAILSYNEPRPMLPLTEFELHENCIMRKMRIIVEHTYKDLALRFDIVNRSNKWKFMNLASNHPAKLRVIFFLNNCVTCAHGNTLSKRCKIDPPTMAEFLEG
jgi:hypothetical protein